MAKSEQSRPSHDEIAQKARELFERSGRKAGHDMENWLTAEAQLIAAKRETSKPAQAAASAPAKPPVTQPQPQPQSAQSQAAGQSRGGLKQGNRPAARNGNSMART